MSRSVHPFQCNTTRGGELPPDDNDDNRAGIREAKKFRRVLLPRMMAAEQCDEYYCISQEEPQSRTIGARLCTWRWATGQSYLENVFRDVVRTYIDSDMIVSPRCRCLCSCS